mgnify:CR=1 FL=1
MIKLNHLNVWLEPSRCFFITRILLLCALKPIFKMIYRQKLVDKGIGAMTILVKALYTPHAEDYTR